MTTETFRTIATSPAALIERDETPDSGHHYRITRADGTTSWYVMRRDANSAFARANGVTRWQDAPSGPLAK
jgi:hypothetical protein